MDTILSRVSIEIELIKLSAVRELQTPTKQYKKNQPEWIIFQGADYGICGRFI
jgi:hypothetical protein